MMAPDTIALTQTSRGRHREQCSSSPIPQGVFGHLIPELQLAVAAEGYVSPTPIQQQCIPKLLDGNDLIGTAQTGTGKTAAFILPLLQKLSENKRRPLPCTPRALIIAPTRELAVQIDVSIKTYGRFLNFRHTVIYGGIKPMRQIKALENGVDILTATPGRLLDLMSQGYIYLNHISHFILDEVDQMLDMGFIPDIRKVLAKLPADRQTLFFSATMPPRIASLADSMVRNPVRISIDPEKPTLEAITQKVLFVEKRKKGDLLKYLVKNTAIQKAIVFTQMKWTADKVAGLLNKAGIDGIAIHSNKSQAARTRALDDFKRGRYHILVATDVAARGLDVDDISHVINYDIPIESEIYIHRIGRTARAGSAGDAISFCSPEERNLLRNIEKLLGKPIPSENNSPTYDNEPVKAASPYPHTRRKTGKAKKQGGQRRNNRNRISKKGNQQSRGKKPRRRSYQSTSS